MKFFIRRDLAEFYFGGFSQNLLGREVKIIERNGSCAYVQFSDGERMEFKLSELTNYEPDPTKLPKVFGSKDFKNVPNGLVMCTETLNPVRTAGKCYRIINNKIINDCGNPQEIKQEVFTLPEPLISVLCYKKEEPVYNTKGFHKPRVFTYVNSKLKSLNSTELHALAYKLEQVELNEYRLKNKLKDDKPAFSDYFKTSSISSLIDED